MKASLAVALAFVWLATLTGIWMLSANEAQINAGYSYEGNVVGNPHVPYVEGSKVFSSAGDASTMRPNPSSMGGDTQKICDHSTNFSNARGVGIDRNGNRHVIQDSSGNGGGCAFGGLYGRAHYGCSGLNAGCGPVSRH